MLLKSNVNKHLFYSENVVFVAEQKLKICCNGKKVFEENLKYSVLNTSFEILRCCYKICK